MLSKLKTGDIITAIEFGTSAIRIAIGRADAESIEILAHAEQPSGDAVVKGEIADMDQATNLLQKVISDAEDAADMEVPMDSAKVAVTGGHIVSREGAGTCLISGENNVVTAEDVRAAEENAKKSVDLAGNEITIETFSGNYVLDDKRHSNKPVGQIARRLEAKVLVLVGDRNRTDNFLAPLRDNGFEKPKLFFTGLSAAIPTVPEDEHDKGVIFLDMGAGTTEYAFLRSPSVLLTGVLPVGCDHIANDISIALNLPFSPICQELAMKDISKLETSFIDLPGEYAKRQVPKETVRKIIEMRLRETFEIVRGKFDAAGLLSQAASGVVFTGGGAMLPESRDILRNVFDMPVRVAGYDLPDEFSGATAGLDSPRYSSLLGMLMFGASTESSSSPLAKLDHGINSMIRKTFKYMRSAFKL